MAGKLSGSRRRSHTKSRAKNRQHLQKPNGAITNRVTKVGGDRFAIVCVDPAKNRSEWMMADYFGKLLIEPQTLEHQSGHFKAAIVKVRQAQQEYQIKDTIVVVERTGNYHLPPKRAFASAGFETRVVHPFATKQYRMPADPGNKTDETDLHAQHRAAVAGFGLCERELPITFRELQLRSRHRRNLVEKSSSLACQIRDNLHLSMPGYAALFDRLLEHQTAMLVGRCCESPAKVLKLGRDGICKRLRKETIRCNQRAIDKILSWASQSTDAPIQDGALHHAIFTDLEELYQHLNQQITAIERDLAGVLVQTPYVRLMAIPGINVVSAADLAAEMGPIDGYANANAITGRCGLFPSRHQSDQTDSSGPIIRKANRRLRCALMRIADNLAAHCAYYRGLAEQDFARGVDIRASRVKTAKKFSRLFDASHPTVSEFAQQVRVKSDYPFRHFNELNAIFESAKQEYEGGYLFVIRNLVHASIFSDELTQAEHLLSENWKTPAAVIAGVALETTLRELCEQHPDLEPTQSANRMNQDLAREGVYNKMIFDQVQAWMKIRNSAAHGKPDEFDENDVKRMIEGVRDFIANHMS